MSLPVLPAQTPFDLSTLALPADLRIAVLAPHPDDFDAIAVTLRHLHASGASIHLAVLTSGASGVEDGFAGAFSAADKTTLREAEQRASCARFGLPPDNLCFLRLPGDAKGNPQVNEDNLATIRDWLLPINAHLVFMPHGNDSNVTHQRTYTLFRQIALEAGLRLWAMLNQDAKTIAMRHDAYLPFTAAEAEWKAELLRLHASQQQRNLNTRGHGFDQRVLAINQRNAADLGIAACYAEVFEIDVYPQ